MNILLTTAASIERAPIESGRWREPREPANKGQTIVRPEGPRGRLRMAATLCTAMNRKAYGAVARASSSTERMLILLYIYRR